MHVMWCMYVLLLVEWVKRNKLFPYSAVPFLSVCCAVLNHLMQVSLKVQYVAIWQLLYSNRGQHITRVPINCSCHCCKLVSLLFPDWKLWELMWKLYLHPVKAEFNCLTSAFSESCPYTVGDFALCSCLQVFWRAVCVWSLMKHRVTARKLCGCLGCP